MWLQASAATRPQGPRARACHKSCQHSRPEGTVPQSHVVAGRVTPDEIRRHIPAYGMAGSTNHDYKLALVVQVVAASWTPYWVAWAGQGGRRPGELDRARRQGDAGCQSFHHCVLVVHARAEDLAAAGSEHSKRAFSQSCRRTGGAARASAASLRGWVANVAARLLNGSITSVASLPAPPDPGRQPQSVRSSAWTPSLLTHSIWPHQNRYLDDRIPCSRHFGE